MGLRGRIGIAARTNRGRARAEVRIPRRGPIIPEGLSDNAKREWRRVTSLLRERGVLDALDQAALHDYLICWQHLQQCESIVARDGVMIAGERGMVKNPACQLARQYREALLAWCKEFGLTLGSRERLALPVPEPPTRNKWAEIG